MLVRVVLCIKSQMAAVLIFLGRSNGRVSWALGPKQISQAIEDEDPKTIDKVNDKAGVKLSGGDVHTS